MNFKSALVAPVLASALTFVGAPTVAPALAQSSIDQGSATYRVTFVATWSPTSHPGAYPPNAHFSPLIGATHGAGYSMWGPGETATLGLEFMAEVGSTGSLSSEIGQAIAAGTAGSVIQGGGAGSPGTATATFTVDADFPLVSLTTMVAPSPDWFVGVHDLDLLASGDWTDSLVVPLFAYDAGTDSGTGFQSANANTVPRDPIALQVGGPFQGTTPLGTFRFERLHSSLAHGPNVADSLVVESGEPRLGQIVRLRATDPTSNFGPSALVVTGLAPSAQADFANGLVLPDFGLVPGTPGSILVDGPVQFLPIRTLGTNGAPIDLGIPNLAGLVGAQVHVQSALVDTTSFRVGGTQAVALVIGS